MGNLEISEVLDAGTRREIVMLPWAVYSGDRNWVPPLIKEHEGLLDPNRNPFFRKAEVALWAARRDGSLVGTIASFIDPDFNAHLHTRVGFWGFFEVLNDYEAAAGLFAQARDWLRDRGMQELRGPINFHRDRERGLLVSGDDCPPPLLCAHSPGYYKGFAERFGMRKYADDLCRRLWVSDVVGPAGELPPRIARLEKVAQRRSHIKIRKASFDRWDAEVQLVQELYDATIGKLPDHVPWSSEDMHSFAAEVRAFLDPDFVLFGEVEGKTVGCLVAFLDFNQMLLRMNGRVDGWRKLVAWWHLKHVDTISLKIGGVLEEYQGRGIEALMLVQIAKAAVRRGFRMVDLSLLAEENDKLTTLVGHFPAQEYKRYRVYTLPI